MQKVFGGLLYLIPKNLLSYWTGWLVHRRPPGPLRLWSLKWFARRYQLNLEEAEKPLQEYSCIGELFTRQLKEGARPMAEGLLIHPVDARLTACGGVQRGQLIQAKGRKYLLRDFVAESTLAERFEGGHFATYYLCPTDYHRVHAPVEGRVKKVLYIPGRLWPVNEWSVGAVANLFAVNERLVIEIEVEDQGRPRALVLVMVGATNVGQMSLSFDPEWLTNQGASEVRCKSYTHLELKKGQELGVFHMGSTVVALYEPGLLPAEFQFIEGPVKMGERLAR